jgi:hypothetical protein
MPLTFQVAIFIAAILRSRAAAADAAPAKLRGRAEGVPVTDHPWTARRILTELCDRPRREAIAAAFWQDADTQSKAVALAELSRALSFRPESLRKAPVDKKASLLLSRLPSPRFTEVFENALMLYHLRHARPLMGAFLDCWGIAHADGVVEADEHTPPSPAAVDDAVAKLRGSFATAELALYLATVGLLMEGLQAGWQAGTWPAADALAAELVTSGDAPVGA